MTREELENRYEDFIHTILIDTPDGRERKKVIDLDEVPGIIDSCTQAKVLEARIDELEHIYLLDSTVKVAADMNVLDRLEDDNELVHGTDFVYIETRIKSLQAEKEKL